MDVREWENLKSTKHFEDLLEFPCSFHIKVICRSGGWVQQALEERLASVPPDPAAQFLDQRLSRGGKYISFTIRLEVVSASHLRGCYSALDGLACVRLVL